MNILLVKEQLRYLLDIMLINEFVNLNINIIDTYKIKEISLELNKLIDFTLKVSYKKSNHVIYNSNLEVFLNEVADFFYNIKFCNHCDLLFGPNNNDSDKCKKCLFMLCFEQNIEHECCICKESIKNDIYKSDECCGNYFHKICIQDLIVCPLCRYGISEITF